MVINKSIKLSRGVKVKGLSTKDILNMDVYKLNNQSLKQVTQRLVSSANKRLRRLYQKAPSSPALRFHLDDMGNLKQFTTKGIKGNPLQIRNQLESLMKQIKGFMNAPSSTIRGFNIQRNEVIKRIGEFESTDQENEFWNVYKKWIDKHPNQFNRLNMDTNELQAMFYDEFVTKGKSARGTSSSITRVINKMLGDITNVKMKNDLALESELKGKNAIKFNKDF